MNRVLSPWSTTRLDIADQCFGFHNPNIWLFADNKKIVDDVAGHLSPVSPVIWQADLVYGATVNLQRPESSSDHYSSFNHGARSCYGCVLTVPQAKLCRELGRHFCEQFWLQFGEVGQRAGHASGRMVFGQAIRRKDVWIARVTRRAHVRVVGPLFFLRCGIVLLRIKRILDQ